MLLGVDNRYYDGSCNFVQSLPDFSVLYVVEKTVC